MMAHPGISARSLDAVINRYETGQLATRTCAVAPQTPSWEGETGAYATEASPFMLLRLKLHRARAVPTRRRPGRLPTALGVARGALSGHWSRSLLRRVAAARHVPQGRPEPLLAGSPRALGGALGWGRGSVQQGLFAIRHRTAAGKA